MANAWAILGLSAGASAAEIRAAYRAMARRWHPDRFAEGPERLWAEQKMMEINQAYCALMQQQRTLETPSSPGAFPDVRRLMELGNLSAARQALMRIAARDAAWNYLFGDVLFRLGEYKKAVLYLSVAAHQCPENADYRKAYDSARGRCAQNRVQTLWRNMTQAVERGARRVTGKG